MSIKVNTIKACSIVGAIMVWIPILAPIIFSILFLLRTSMFRFDYLMPAELFPIALLGGGILLGVSIWKKTRIKSIAYCYIASILSLFLGQIFAVITGLAAGAIAPNNWQMVLVITSITCYVLLQILLGIEGILLTRDYYLNKQN
jgi:hypothetical protein